MASIDVRPREIASGLFGATVYRDEEPIYLRMELLTEENAPSWAKFSQMSKWMSKTDNRGVLNHIVEYLDPRWTPFKEKHQEYSGFSNEEWMEFVGNILEGKEKAPRLKDILYHHEVGVGHLSTTFERGKLKYIVYASKTPNFSIRDHRDLDWNDFTIKKYIEAYGNLLMTVGFDGYKREFRGISRSPFWVAQGKYQKMSMWLPAFIGAVMAKYFPENKEISVKPIGVMGRIIQKHLHRGEAFVEADHGKVDLMDYKIPNWENPRYYIRVAALVRVYLQEILYSIDPFLRPPERKLVALPPFPSYLTTQVKSKIGFWRRQNSSI